MVGDDLFRSGLITTHGGNLSVRAGDRIIITRQGSMLAHLASEDLVETGLWTDDTGRDSASRELPVHRAIYATTPAQAVVHAHPPTAVALSLAEEHLHPLDVEGSHRLREVPVVTTQEAVGTEESGRRVAALLGESRVVMVRGHGSFAWGTTLEEALCRTSVLEASSRILLLARTAGLRF
jgi:L-fuculose-phosphate aldolase